MSPLINMSHAPSVSARPAPRKRCCARCKTPYGCGAREQCRCHDRKEGK